MTELIADHLTVRAKQTVLVEDASLRLAPGELVVLLGPNGAGKTSLLRACLGLTRPDSGHASLAGQDTTRLSPMQRARGLAYLPQIRQLAWPNIVRDVVALGRFSHGAALGQLRAEDAEAVDRAIQDCDLAHLADRKADTLSGGELVRMHCARAFATEAPLLIADEPIAALDPRHQFRILDLISGYVKRGGGALIVLHDIGLAARYASRLIWMQQGRIVADGTPAETLTQARIEAIYNVRAHIDGLRVELAGPL